MNMPEIKYDSRGCVANYDEIMNWARYNNPIIFRCDINARTRGWSETEKLKVMTVILLGAAECASAVMIRQAQLIPVHFEEF